MIAGNGYSAPNPKQVLAKLIKIFYKIINTSVIF